MGQSIFFPVRTIHFQWADFKRQHTRQSVTFVKRRPRVRRSATPHPDGKLVSHQGQCCSRHRINMKQPLNTCRPGPSKNRQNSARSLYFSTCVSRFCAVRASNSAASLLFPELPSSAEIETLIDRLVIPHWKNLEKKLVRRLDPTLMPMLWILYVTNYLDRAFLSKHASASPASTPAWASLATSSATQSPF
jgi:hypothetical protein